MSRFPIINVDHSKCTTPFDCKLCLQKCPQAVFEVIPIKMTKFKETDPKEPGSYRLMTTYRRKCTACGKCVEICPNDAITIEM